MAGGAERMGPVLSTLIVLGAGLLGTLGWYGPIYLYALAIPVFIGLVCSPLNRHSAIARTISLTRRASLFRGAKWRRSA
ncbi:major facilitator family transporter [Klebsiella variicola]|nr:major facilitator family transporter [Klebsiella variicola]